MGDVITLKLSGSKWGLMRNKYDAINEFIAGGRKIIVSLFVFE